MTRFAFPFYEIVHCEMQNTDLTFSGLLPRQTKLTWTSFSVLETDTGGRNKKYKKKKDPQIREARSAMTRGGG